MIKIATWDRATVTLQEVLEPGKEAPPNWYNPLFGCFTNVRMVRLIRKLPAQEIEKMITSDLHIYTIVSHEPIFSQTDNEAIKRGETTREAIRNRQRIRDEDGDDYIDEFGRYVYLTSRVGRRSQKDQDLRYDGVPDPELFPLKYVEDDLSDRKTNRADARLPGGSIRRV